MTKNIFLFLLSFIFSPFLFTQKINAQVSNGNLSLDDSCKTKVIEVAREIKRYGVREVRIGVHNLLSEYHKPIKNELNTQSVLLALIPYRNEKSFQAVSNIMNSPVLMRNWIFRIHLGCNFGYYSIGQDHTDWIINFAIDQNRNFFEEQCFKDLRKLKNPVSEPDYIDSEGGYCAYVPFKR